MKKKKKLRVVSLCEKMIWLLVHCSIMNALLLFNTNNAIRMGFVHFVDYPKDFYRDGDVMTIIIFTLMNSWATIYSNAVIFVYNLIVFIIATTIFHLLYFRTITNEKEIFLSKLKRTLALFSILGIILLVIINIKSFVLAIFLACFHYLSFSSLSGLLIRIRIKRIYKNYNIDEDENNL